MGGLGLQSPRSPGAGWAHQPVSATVLFLHVDDAFPGFFGLPVRSPRCSPATLPAVFSLQTKEQAGTTGLPVLPPRAAPASGPGPHVLWHMPSPRRLRQTTWHAEPTPGSPLPETSCVTLERDCAEKAGSHGKRTGSDLWPWGFLREVYSLPY